MSETRNKDRKMKNKVFVIRAVDVSNPPNPKMVPTTAITRKIIARRYIFFIFRFINNRGLLPSYSHVMARALKLFFVGQAFWLFAFQVSLVQPIQLPL
jgi:hypothetical protein